MSAMTTDPVPNIPPAKPRRKKPGRAVVIPFVDWKMYEELLKVFESKPRLRLTYDRGALEIMVPSQEQEGDSSFLGWMILILAKEFKLPVRSGGSTTIKRKRMKKGLEPDKCFWIANAAKMAGVRQLDLKVHPAPDLAIEVDVTNSSLDRFGIYRKLGVRELWRLDGDELRFYKLGTDKKYAEAANSPTFVGITPADLMVFVKQARGVVDENQTADAFQVWVRQRIAAGNPPPTSS